MRLDVHIVNVQPIAALKEYTQARLWLGLQPFAQWILGAGVWLTESPGESPARCACRIRLWLRRIGPVMVRQVEDNPYIAVDLAIARMRQKVARRVKRALRAAGRTEADTAWYDAGPPPRGWLAYRAWEDDGGRNHGSPQMSGGRQRSVARRQRLKSQQRELVPCG